VVIFFGLQTQRTAQTQGTAGAIFAGPASPGISTKCTADGAHEPEMRHKMEPGGSIGAACGARRTKHAVHWPDTPKFSDREDPGHRVGPLTPNGASPPRCFPANFTPVPLGGDPARFADQSAILDGGYPVAVPSGARAKTAHAFFLLMAGHVQRLGRGAPRPRV